MLKTVFDFLTVGPTGGSFVTNFTHNFAGILDYIWYSPERFVVTSILEPVDEESLQAYTALPNPKYPSDHIALLCELELLPQARQLVRK